MRLLSDASLASARRVSRSTLGKETFTIYRNVGSTTDFGSEQSWSAVETAIPARLSPERSMSQVSNGRVMPERRFVLEVKPDVDVKERDRVIRDSDSTAFRVIGVDGPQTDDAIAKTVRLEMEKVNG